MMNHQIWKAVALRGFKRGGALEFGSTICSDKPSMVNLPFMDKIVEPNIGFHIKTSSSRDNFDYQFMDDENPQSVEGY